MRYLQQRRHNHFCEISVERKPSAIASKYKKVKFVFSHLIKIHIKESCDLKNNTPMILPANGRELSPIVIGAFVIFMLVDWLAESQ